MVLIGRSGSGKTALATRLKERHGYVTVKTCTTRGRREGEPSEAYEFLSRDEFKELVQKNELAEWDTYGGNMYGTRKSAQERDEKMILVLTSEGAEAVKKAFPDAFVVHVQANMKTAVLRAISREHELTPATLNRIDKRAMTDYYLYDHPACDYTADNRYGQDLDWLAQDVAAAHEAYGMNALLRELSDDLRSSREELQAYDREKKAQSEVRG